MWKTEASIVSTKRLEGEWRKYKNLALDKVKVDQPLMNSVGKQCNELKEQYDSCFQSWFSEKFLKGETNDEICMPLFKLYQQCLKIEFMEACRELKEEYDKCFNIWFSQKFLRGDYNDDMCAELLKVYKGCVKKTMVENQIEFKEVVKDNLGTENEHKIPPKS